MLQKIIELSIKNRTVVLLGALLLAVIGVYSTTQTTVDAIPDLSDSQVILYTEHPGQSPQTVEDQVTYPLTTALVSVPGAKTVRGYSFFGYSLIYLIFDDGTDLYWARSRILETLSSVKGRLPNGVEPSLGPDASGVGWVYQYALQSDSHSLQELRSLQDWFLKYELSSLPGVSEVASVGGFVKQYQVTVHPDKLRQYGVALSEVEEAVRHSSGDEGGEAFEWGETEWMVRAMGYVKSVRDLQQLPIRNSAQPGLPPILLRDLATVTIGPEMRRGVADLDGEGEVIGGIVVMRSGENALQVINSVKNRLVDLEKSLPKGVKIIPVYDRSSLIMGAVDHLKFKLFEEIAMVALVSLLFLFHLRSALVATVVLPLSILIALTAMHLQGINANIMSLGGIAIAIGAMVDAAIIMIENGHRHLEKEQQKPPNQRRAHWETVAIASKEVGPALFFSLLVITVSFVPILTLGEQEGRLFRPLAWTKTYAMAAACLTAITVVPVLIGYFVRGKILPEQRNPLNRFFEKIYHPIVHAALRHPYRVLSVAAAAMLATFYPFQKLGSEFMPPLQEGDLLYMPTTMPGISITKSKELLQQTNKLIKTVPEVARVFGKAGRAETATDPAGLEMFESVIQFIPQEQWRPGVTIDSLIKELDARVKIPGLTNSWTMPIKTRIDMLSTGINTPVGIKISGPNLDTLQLLGEQIESVLRTVPGTTSAFAERSVGGNYLDIKIDRTAAARLGVSVEQIRQTVRVALGGMAIAQTVEGLERYSINLRYPRELRDSPEKIGELLIDLPSGGAVPLGRVATISPSRGAMMIRSENSRPNSFVFVNTSDGDLGGYVARARATLQEELQLPPSYSIGWSGQFENMERMEKRMMVVVPLTLLIILLILYLNTKSLTKTAIIFAAVPFSLVGAVWILYLLGYNLSLAVWVGVIALAGLDAETGVVMLLYLDHAYDDAKQEGKMATIDHLHDAIDHGAVKRVRPKVMTASVILAGLIPILWSNGAGADVMKRIAAPMVGGVVTSVAMELVVYPVLYLLWKRKKLSQTKG